MGNTVQQNSQVIKLKGGATFIHHFEYLVVCVHNVQEGCQIHQNDAKKCEEPKRLVSFDGTAVDLVQNQEERGHAQTDDD